MKLPLPRSRRARLVAGVVALAAAGGVGGVTVLGGAPAPAEAAAAAAPTPAHPALLLTVDPAALPEAQVPADAPVIAPEGDGGLRSVEQLAALDGASVERDREGRLRVTHGDWRASATELDAVRGLPGVVTAEAAGEHAFLVTTDLAPDQLAELPGIVAVATEDGTPVPEPSADTGDTQDTGDTAGEPAAEEGGH